MKREGGPTPLLGRRQYSLEKRPRKRAIWLRFGRFVQFVLRFLWVIFGRRRFFRNWRWRFQRDGGRPCYCYSCHSNSHQQFRWIGSRNQTQKRRIRRLTRELFLVGRQQWTIITWKRAIKVKKNGITWFYFLLPLGGLFSTFMNITITSVLFLSLSSTRIYMSVRVVFFNVRFWWRLSSHLAHILLLLFLLLTSIFPFPCSYFSMYRLLR